MDIIYLTTVCQNSDDGATDNGGTGCDYYENHPDPQDICGKLDNTDFIASQMCCACRGILLF